jgi:phage terminase small subunit
VRPAAIRAGYSATSNSVYQWLKRPEIMARVEKFRRRRAPAATGDLEPVIERLLAAADSAAALNSAPGLRAVCGLLTQAAKLKQLLPSPEAAGPGGL